MSILNIFRSQLASVIEWKPERATTLWWRYPSQRNEIINASKLIVAPGQGAVLVYEGEVVDVIESPGTFNLKTDNHPFSTTLSRLRQNFESEHKLYIYFYRSTEVLAQAWGTSTPIKLHDKTYNLAMELGAYGNFSYRIADVNRFFTEIIGSRATLDAEELRPQIGQRIVASIGSGLHSSGLDYLTIDGQLPELGRAIHSVLSPELEGLGLELKTFYLEGVQYDAESETRIQRIAEIQADIYAAEQAGIDYVQLEKLRALRDAAANEGGLSGAGLQMGAGLEIGRQMGGFATLAQSGANQPGSEGGEAPSNTAAERLRQLKELHSEGLITDEELASKRAEILANL